MSRAASTALAVLLLLLSALPVAANDPKPAPPAVAPDQEPEPPTTAAEPEIIPGEVVVKWRDAPRGLEVARSRGLAVVAEIGVPGAGLPTVLSTGGRPVEQVIGELQADPSVEYAEPNYRVHVATEGEGEVAAVGVNDPLTGPQYSLNQMRVRDAWSLSRGGNGLVAVLDTGVQFNHPDLAGRLVAGHDFVNNDGDASDDNGHGTWVAGIIAANPNDGYGIAGISWSDKVLPVKIMNREGTGSTSNLSAGIVYAANRGATVINMSVGGFPYLQSLQDSINYAWSKGAILVGAAGNNRRHEEFYPASYNNVISVSATQVDDEFSNWSSWGPKVDVSAPGSSVLTTNCYACSYAGHDTWGSHAYLSGTSFATPNVAGVVALLRARYPSYSPAQIVSRLLTTVDDRGYPGFDTKYGHGRVNAYRALGASVGGPGPSTGDPVEPNNTLGQARMMGLGTTHRPSIHPAGDVDVFGVDVPRAGRLDVRVTGVVDTRAYPWHKSGLPVDPIVELYNTAGTLLLRVDREWESGTELAQLSLSGPTRILIRVSNWYANGNTTAYSLTPTFVDTVPPVLVGRTPSPGAGNISYDGAVVTATFNEPVTGISSSSFKMTDAVGTVPVTVTWDAGANRATLRPNRPLAGEVRHTVWLTNAIRDLSGNAFAATSWSFLTGKAVPRIGGVDRFDTAARVSQSSYGPNVPAVFIATGRSFPDALAGGPAAYRAGGPLLLVTSGGIPSATAAELARLRPGRIVVVGGPSVVSDGVLQALRAYTTGTVTRQFGADRFATAAAISRAGWPSGSGLVYVATGSNYPDALAAGAVAARNGAPILLVRPDAVPQATADALRALGPSRIVVMGAASVVSDAVVAQLRGYAPDVQRVAGADRYATAVALSAATYAANSVSHVYIATGTSFPDGLAIGPVAGRSKGPLLLVPGNRLPAEVAAELRRLDPTNVVIVGGPAVVLEGVRDAIRNIWR